MRSGSTALAVLLVCISSLAGCGGSSESKAYEARSPHWGGGKGAASPASYEDSTAAAAAAPAPPSPSPSMDGPRDEVVEAVALSANRRVASAGDDDREEAPDDAPQPAPPPPPSQPQASSPGAAAKPEKVDPAKEPAQTRDLVIYTARFTMAVYQVEQGLAAVEKIARDNGGFLGQKRDREITVRVPRGRFETTLAAIDKVGDVLHREIQAQDVTDEHVDLEIRIKNARAMQQRLTLLLAKANVKDALEIEKELHRVTQELELLEGRMKVLKDKIALSTITVVFQPRGVTLQTSRVRLPFPWLGALNLPSLLSLSEEK